MQERSDKQLIVEYLDGDGESLEILIRQYLKPIYNFAYGYVGNAQDAEDITQEAFVKAWKNLKRFNQQKSFKTWIFAIVKNSCIDFLKKKKTIPFSAFSARGGSAFGGENKFAETLADPSPLPGELLERKSIREILAKAIEKLSLKYRKVLSLHYNDNLAFREIAESLGEPLNTVKSRHRRALTTLKKLLAEP